MKCETCNQDTDDVIFSRGYLWHRPCANTAKDAQGLYVLFPSAGKIVPDTIIQTDDYDAMVNYK